MPALPLLVIERLCPLCGQSGMAQEQGEKTRSSRRWRWLGVLWAYMGTMAALALLIGVLGMGIYHLMEGKRESLQTYRCFSGIYNSARAEAPVGLGEMTPGQAKSGGAHLRFEYGENGRLNRLVHLDAGGYRREMPGSRVAEQRLEYDAAGHVLRKSNYGADGTPAPDASGVAERRYSYDAAGRLVETSFYNELGENVAPYMPGYARRRIQYDSVGRPLRIEYLDAAGQPMVNARGESRVDFDYRDELGEVVRTNRVDGALRANRSGVAVVKKQTANGGSTRRTAWYDAAGKPVVHPRVGAAAVQQDVSSDGKYARYRWCKESGTMRGKSRVCAEHLIRSTATGAPEWECFNADDGLPCMNEALGYAERVCEYGPDGSLSRELFWDASGNPTFCYEQRHSRSGDACHVLRLNTDGSTELRRVF